VRHGHDSIFSKEGTGGELVVGDGGGVGEAPGSAKSWVDEVGKEVAAGAAPGDEARCR
jgi:hypothetical protein